MIQILLEGHNWQYSVEDVIRLYYAQDKPIFTDKQPPKDFRGIFILSSFFNNAEEYFVKTFLFVDGVKIQEIVFKIVVGKSKATNDYLKAGRREVKRQIYLVLSEYENKKLHWGTLTGIRPAKIVNELMDEIYDEQEIKTHLKDFYLVSDEKIELVYEVALNEKSILEKAYPDTVGVYIGIPFCPSRCLYCSFTSNPINRYAKKLNLYFDALKYEMIQTSELLKEKGLKIQSIYIGGGTPTSIDAESLKELLKSIEDIFDLSNLLEYTLEAGRPDSLDEEKLRVIKNSKVDRISINPQTMKNETLELIGRKHTAEDIVNIYKKARDIGFDNINMDLIVGLPGETINDFKNTLEKIKVLSPDSITVHSLAMKKASVLNKNKEAYEKILEEDADTMVSLAYACAKDMEMQPYYLYRQKNMVGDLENIGYSKKGKESIYNVQIMEERQTIVALGAGAVTKVVFPEENRIERVPNLKGVEEYIARIEEMVQRKKQML